MVNALRGYLFILCKACLHQFAVPERLEHGYVSCPHCGSRILVTRDAVA